MNLTSKQIKSLFKPDEVGRVLYSESLSNYSSWEIGGSADVLIEPENAEQISNLIKLINKSKIDYITIGGGSNLLFADDGFRGIVIKIGKVMSEVKIEGNNIFVQAGKPVPRIARATGLAGLSGIEHAIGIPGTIGGLVAMNGGSQRKGIGEVVEKVVAVDKNGKILEFRKSDCNFSYRNSIFLQGDHIITDVFFKLTYGDKKRIFKEMLDILRQRRSKFPRREPNCGSVFVSDPTLYEKCGPPGKIIEELGLKGFSVGDAQVSLKHANFIINKGGATAKDMLGLIKIVRDNVFKKTNIWLDCEVRFVSSKGSIRPAHEILANEYKNRSLKT